jgi:hypothetical protein
MRELPNRLEETHPKYLPSSPLLGGDCHHESFGFFGLPFRRPLRVLMFSGMTEQLGKN